MKVSKGKHEKHSLFFFDLKNMNICIKKSFSWRARLPYMLQASFEINVVCDILCFHTYHHLFMDCIHPIYGLYSLNINVFVAMQYRCTLKATRKCRIL